MMPWWWRFNNRWNSRPGPRDWRDTVHWRLATLCQWTTPYVKAYSETLTTLREEAWR